MKSDTKVFLSLSTKLIKENNALVKSFLSCIKDLGFKLSWDWINQPFKDEKQLYNKSISAIKRSSVLVAEITYPSTGVGQQIALANSNSIPVLCLINDEDGSNTSSFTLGSENKMIQIANYNKSNLKEILANNLKELMKEKFIKFNFIITPDLNEYIETESEKRNLSKSQFLREILKKHQLRNK